MLFNQLGGLIRWRKGTAVPVSGSSGHRREEVKKAVSRVRGGCSDVPDPFTGHGVMELITLCCSLLLSCFVSPPNQSVRVVYRFSYCSVCKVIECPHGTICSGALALFPPKPSRTWQDHSHTLTVSSDSLHIHPDGVQSWALQRWPIHIDYLLFITHWVVTENSP